MPYIPQDLKTAAFIAGKTELYQLLNHNPQLRMVPIDRVETVRNDIKQLGYDVRVRYRGPHWPLGDTVKARARAATLYVANE